MTDVVRARGLTKHYGKFTALSNVDFAIEPGAIVGLIGPNGAGKTTTLKAVLGLTDFDGDLTVMGQDPRRARHRIMEDVCFVADASGRGNCILVNTSAVYRCGQNCAGFIDGCLARLLCRLAGGAGTS